jgi:hypothetical protein
VSAREHALSVNELRSEQADEPLALQQTLVTHLAIPATGRTFRPQGRHQLCAAAATTPTQQSCQSAAARCKSPAAPAMLPPSALPQLGNLAMLLLPLLRHASRAATVGAASHQLGDGDVAAALGAVVRGVFQEGR